MIMDPPTWFVVLLAVFLLVVFAIITAGSIIIAASIYRNFLRPGVKPAPLNKPCTVIVLSLLIALILPATVSKSPYWGFVMVKSVLLVLLTIAAWTVIWHRTAPRKTAAARTGASRKKIAPAKPSRKPRK